MEVPTAADDLGTWLKELRDAAGLTQDELANAAETDRRTIQRWEAGQEKAADVVRVLTALGVKFEPPLPESVKAVGAQVRELKAMIQEIDQLIRTAEGPANPGDREGGDDVADLEEAARRLSARANPGSKKATS